MLHPKNVLDTLGADAPETLCKAEVATQIARPSAAAAPRMRCRRCGPSCCASCCKFSRQYGRLVSALVRPLLWLAVFAAGFRNVFGVAIVEPYDTYIPYDVYIAPGLVGMVLLFNGMQSSLAMVYDREMGLMRLLLTAPLPRPWLLFASCSPPRCCRCCRRRRSWSSPRCSAPTLPLFGPQTLHVLLARGRRRR